MVVVVLRGGKGIHILHLSRRNGYLCTKKYAGKIKDPDSTPLIK